MEAAPSGEFKVGEKVATVMGGLGRDFDGGYAEFTVVPARQLLSFSSDLAWDVLGGLPEMLQTAWGSLFRALQLAEGERLLIRGGTTSIGMAAAAIASRRGYDVAATSRHDSSEHQLLDNGARHFLRDNGSVADALRKIWPDGAHKVLELIGTSTLVDSLRCAREHGVVCMTGMVGNKWTIDDFSPMEAIPTAVRLTTYDGGVDDFLGMPFQKLIDEVAAKTLPVTIGKVFHLDEIVEAHTTMEENKAHGKIVVLTG